jgi:phosphoheptose isomerase
MSEAGERRDWVAANTVALRAALDELGSVTPALTEAARRLAATLTSGGTILIAGNGGSAAEAQHLAGELIGRLGPDRERGPLAAVALTADTATLTALGNDYGFAEIFARQVRGLGRPGDSLIVLSTSGSSANVVAAVAAATERAMTTVALVGGTTRELHEACDVVLAVPATAINTIQECHLVLIHALVASIEDELDG